MYICAVLVTRYTDCIQALCQLNKIYLSLYLEVIDIKINLLIILTLQVSQHEP